MPTLVGYLTNRAGGLEGTSGSLFDYILAGNGLFIRAGKPLLSTTIQVAPADVRGLPPLQEELVLPHGPIPWAILEATAKLLHLPGLTLRHELYFGVVWEDGAYRKVVPEQSGRSASVQYQRVPHTLLDVHTHGNMAAFFSSTDNQDETGFQLYMVLGDLDQPVAKAALRVGVYGYFAPLDWEEVFDRPPPPWLEVVSAKPNFDPKTY